MRGKGLPGFCRLPGGRMLVGLDDRRQALGSADARMLLEPAAPGIFAPILQIEAVGVHDLAPGSHEILDELLLRVALGIDFRKGAQL